MSVALNKLNLEPSQVVMIGDTPYDIESAGKCGVRVIAVRYGGFKNSQLIEALATYGDPANLVAHFADSPLCKTA